MCTEECPCFSGKDGEATPVSDLWKGYSDADFSNAGADKADLFFSDIKDGTVDTWLECFERTKKEADSETDDDSKKTKQDNVAKITAFMKSEGFDFMKSAEDKFSCGGVCKPPMFFLTKSITEGKPEMDCLSAVLEDIPGKLRLPGLISVLLGLLLICAFIAAFPLC